MKFSSTLVRSTTTTPLGNLTLAASVKGLAGLWFDDQKHRPTQADTWVQDDANPLLTETARQLKRYFAGDLKVFHLPLDMDSGTAFQQAVWAALLELPMGSTTSYGSLSAWMGKPTAVRAVGGAVGRNPLGIIVPCHRVLGGDGSLTGYAGGLARKTALLRLEATTTGKLL
jgi:methylated-DNA-[protein]-cysteine S-methyltransferase